MHHDPVPTAMIAPILLCVLSALPPSGAAPTEAASGAHRAQPVFAGKSLLEALDLFENETGLSLAYSERLVRPDLRVTSEPAGTTDAQLLRSLLRPHGLDARPNGEGTWIVVPGPEATVRGRVVDRRTREAVEAARVSVPSLGLETSTDSNGDFVLTAAQTGSHRLQVEAAGYPRRQHSVRFRRGPSSADLVLALDAPLLAVEEIVVTPSHFEISRSEPLATIALDHGERELLAVPGGDLMRAAATLPGATSADYSAQLHVRGGGANDVLVMLDGLELFEPFHLKDLGSALSLVPPQAVERLELQTGGFSAGYGDRLSGLLQMTSTDPPPSFSGFANLSPVDLSLGLGDSLRDGRLSWYAAARRGLLGEAFSLLEGHERPAFADFFGKVELHTNARNVLRLQALGGRDIFKLEAPEEIDRADHDSSYLWLRHQAIVGDRALAVTVLHAGQLGEDRRGTGSLEGSYEVTDRRDVEFFGIDHRWTLQLPREQSLEVGLTSRDLSSDYDYSIRLDLRDPLAALRHRPATLEERLSASFGGRQDSLFASYRTSPWGTATFEAGLRFDENRLTDDEHVSPRLSFVQAIGDRGTLRGSWGYYYQSLRPHELFVEDGEQRFSRDELAKQTVLGYEHRFTPRLRLRAEVYERLVSEPRVRYVNLLDGFAVFPELGADRVRLESTRSRANGVEIAVQYDRDGTHWRGSYTFARSRDRLLEADRFVTIPRVFDQPHALQLGWSRRLGKAWQAHAELNVHSGWPTTEIEASLSGEGDDARVVPVRGRINGDRLPTYLRLDLRFLRSFSTRWGRLDLTLDLLNATGHGNAWGRNVELGLEESAGGALTPTVTSETLEISGPFPSIGLLLRF